MRFINDTLKLQFMKRILLLLLLCSTTLLMAQQTDPIQEAMASYDYETALSLIAQKKPATPLLLQKGKALRSLGLWMKHPISRWMQIKRI